MALITAPRTLRLTLGSKDQIPADHHWVIEAGYVHWTSWNDEYESVTLGLWGPGDLVMTQPTWMAIPNELRCLTEVIIEQAQPSAAEIHSCLDRQLQQVSELLLINRARPADNRLLELMIWIGKNFGSVSSCGYRISLLEMNLTHKSLAALSGLTRVTVTKSLNRFRTQGLIQHVGESDILIPRSSLPKGSHAGPGPSR